VSAVPEGDCMVPLPWLGVRFGLSSADCVRWFGGGSGDAYPDTRTVSAVGR
jgi:beta-galactosidase